MTNFEKFKHELLDLSRMSGYDLSVRNGVPGVCRGNGIYAVCCKDCDFAGVSGVPCGFLRMEWLASEWKKPEPDWSKVPVDSKVLVSMNGKDWERRYFAEWDGEVITWDEGKTSWTTDHKCRWLYFKPAEEESND